MIWIHLPETICFGLVRGDYEYEYEYENEQEQEVDDAQEGSQYRDRQGAAGRQHLANRPQSRSGESQAPVDSEHESDADSEYEDGKEFGATPASSKRDDAVFPCSHDSPVEVGGPPYDIHCRFAALPGSASEWRD